VIPSRFTLGVRRYAATAADAHGNAVPAFAAAIPWPVRQVDPGAMLDPRDPNRDASVVAFTIHANPHPNAPTERDRVVVDDVEYEVEGHVKDWSRGPWSNPVAGVVVQLRNVKG